MWSGIPMKLFSLKGFAVTLLVLVVVVFIALQIVSRTPSLHTEGAVKDAVDAYIYGYPLITFDMARKQQTNVDKPDEQHAPMNQMINMRTYLPIDNHCCAAPNADTLYTIAWMDVYNEPLILIIPEIRDRYYIVPLLDSFSEVIKVISSINDGSKSQTLAITGPGWSGTLPEGVTEVKSSTAIVWLLGRIYSTGTPEDYKVVNDLQDQFELVPLSAWGKPYTPPPAKVDSDFDMKTAVRAQINSMDVYEEPWILTIPEIRDRYYIVPLLDGFSEVIKVISSINDGSESQTLAITGPGWSGTLPEGVTEVKSSTAIVWLLGRIYSTGTPEDYKVVNDLQDRFELVPLNAWGKPWTPPAGEVDPDFDMKTAARAQINSMDVYTYFNYLARLLKTNPPKPEDAAMVEKLMKIGLVPGEDFDPSTLRGMDTQAVESIPDVAQGELGTQPDVHARPHFTQGIGVVAEKDYDTSKLASLDQKLIKLAPKVGLLKMALRLKQTETTNGWLYFTE